MARTSTGEARRASLRAVCANGGLLDSLHRFAPTQPAKESNPQADQSARPTHGDESPQCYAPFRSRRHVTVPRDMVGEVPKGRIMKEAEWRKLGIIQSCGWEHYAIHK